MKVLSFLDGISCSVYKQDGMISYMTFKKERSKLSIFLSETETVLQCTL